MSWNTGVNDAWTTDDDGFTADAGIFANEGVTINSGADGIPCYNDADDFGDTDDSRACHICHATDHLARECPNKACLMECFNCGELGHAKADCTNSRVERAFTGTCNLCGAEGHRAAECPDQICRFCEQKGHKASQCTAARIDLWKDAKPLDMDTAWDKLKAADARKDMDDIREALFGLFKYKHDQAAKAGRENDISLVMLEDGFRADGFKLHLIAKKKELSAQFTLVNPTGEIGMEYQLVLSWSNKPRIKMHAAGWPDSSEENHDRLAKAGYILETGVPICARCNVVGHISKKCDQPKPEFEGPKITCTNCSQEGHRLRDCPEPVPERVKAGCRNCGQTGHKASDCTEPPNMDNVECRHCNETGHFAKDCPTKPKRFCRNCGEEGHMGADCTNPPKCGNCDEIGHESRECKKPRDWSRVKCKQCGNMGHTIVRCPEAKAAEEPSAVVFDVPAPIPVVASDDW